MLSAARNPGMTGLIFQPLKQTDIRAALPSRQRSTSASGYRGVTPNLAMVPVAEMEGVALEGEVFRAQPALHIHNSRNDASVADGCHSERCENVEQIDSQTGKMCDVERQADQNAFLQDLIGDDGRPCSEPAASRLDRHDQRHP